MEDIEYVPDINILLGMFFEYFILDSQNLSAIGICFHTILYIGNMELLHLSLK